MVAAACFFHEFEQLGGERTSASAQFWWVWRLEWSGSGAVSRRQRSGGGPTHTQNWESRSHRPRAGFVCGARIPLVTRVRGAPARGRGPTFRSSGLEIRIFCRVRFWWVWLGLARLWRSGLRKIRWGARFFRQFEQLGGTRRVYRVWFWWLLLVLARLWRSGLRKNRRGARFFHEFEPAPKRRPAPKKREVSPPPTPRIRSLGLAGRSLSVCVWVWGRGPISHRGGRSVRHTRACACVPDIVQFVVVAVTTTYTFGCRRSGF